MASEAQIRANRENAKKAGRKKGPATLEAERMRNIIAEHLAIHFVPILKKAIAQAKKGDRYAREWLGDRAFGKASQPIEGGLSVKVGKLEEIAYATKAILDNKKPKK